ncbi:MAG: DNA repair protein RadC [Candidatus Desulforudis sp.]|nr:DNA repair protein RadC [Desulforudis sp.]
MALELRPRERLSAHGAQSLSDAELLAIMLRSGTAAATAIDLANQLLTGFGGLRGLMDVGIDELQGVRGVGLAKAAQVKAAVELGRRAACRPGASRPVVRTPEEAAGLVMEEMRYLDREHFRALVLNTKNHVLAVDKISVGTLNSSAVHPRELFKNAIRRSAAAVVLLHNHPSGDPTPSPQDVDLTKRLVEAGEIIGIPVLDHIIIGDNRFTSFKAEGLLSY